jgi:hypothetical protein
VHVADAAARPEAGLEALLDEAAEEVLREEAEQDEDDEDDSQQDEKNEYAAAACHQPSAARDSPVRPGMDCSSKMLTFIDTYNFRV